MYFSSFFVITGILLNFVCHSSSLPTTLCTGKNGSMTIGEETKILSIDKNKNGQNRIIVNSRPDKGTQEKFRFSCHKHSWSTYDFIFFLTCLIFFSLKTCKRIFVLWKIFVLFCFSKLKSC